MASRLREGVRSLQPEGGLSHGFRSRSDRYSLGPVTKGRREPLPKGSRRRLSPQFAGRQLRGLGQLTLARSDLIMAARNGSDRPLPGLGMNAPYFRKGSEVPVRVGRSTPAGDPDRRFGILDSLPRSGLLIHRANTLPNADRPNPIHRRSTSYAIDWGTSRNFRSLTSSTEAVWDGLLNEFDQRNAPPANRASRSRIRSTQGT